MHKELPYVTYSATTDEWDPDEYGNHRAVIEVTDTGSGEAVVVLVPWRRRDRPENKGVLFFSWKGTPVADWLAVDVNRSYGSFVFRPVDGPGRYYLYFMPYTGTVKKPYPTAEYLAMDTAMTPWRISSAGEDPARHPSALVRALESVDEFNRFTEMELTATPWELEVMIRENGAGGFYLFPESRERPIRMVDFLPYRWTRTGPFTRLQEQARPGEYFVFQVGVYAVDGDLHNVEVLFEDLIDERGGAAVPASSMTCYNTGGHGWDGSPLTTTVTVPKGRVQPLWCGIDLPADLNAGDYEVNVTVRDAIAARSVTIGLRVSGAPIERHGDDEPWRLSRIRWLNSTLGTEDTVVPPYTPVERDGNRLSVLGRNITLQPNGLPAGVTSCFTDDVRSVDGTPVDVLAAPLSMHIRTTGGDSVFGSGTFEIVTQAESSCAWISRLAAGSFDLSLTGSLDFDGTMEYQLSLTSDEDANVEDIWLEMPITATAAQLMTGLGRKGGMVPDEFEWSWNPERNQDSFWIGCVNAGVQLTLKDDHYSRPLNTNFYHRKPLVMPGSWANGGRGTIAMRRTEQGYLVSCRSGSRRLRKGAPIRFDFRFVVTPFKPIDTAEHFSTRYYHAYRPIDEIGEAGANAVNIHHATEINPYINYPFLRSDLLGRYIREAHEAGLRVKLYYTVRELTTRAPELFMLKSLGHEVFVGGDGGGHPWLQEHMGEDYIAAWYSLAVRDTSVINGVLSRWHNFYVEGLNWLAENVQIDGVYIDDLGFGREIMKRVRRVLHRHRPAPLIDLHSANQYNVRDGFASSTNLYLEHFPYLDRLWFGEYFDYDEKPDYWLVEVSGIPFGLMGEMLQDGGNLWRGMVFGMTGRMPRVLTNVELWRFWDRYGLPRSEMLGFWSSACPVSTDSEEVKATVYRGGSATVIAVASWADRAVRTRIAVDWHRLGHEPSQVKVYVPGIDGIQADGGELPAGADVTVDLERGAGALIVIDHPA